MVVSNMRCGVFHLFALLTLLLVSDCDSDLFLSHDYETRTSNEIFAVICKDKGGKSVTWRGPRGHLNARTRPQVQVAAFGTTITFDGTVISDSGTYSCSTDTETKNFTLFVSDPIIFVNSEPVQVGQEGGEVVLRCEVKGGEISWAIVGADWETMPLKYNKLGDGLRVRNLTLDDAYKNYTCLGIQPETGEVKKLNITLIVNHEPRLPPNYAKEIVVWGYIGGTVNLTCEVEAVPPPEFQWSKTKGRIRFPHQIQIQESSHKSILQVEVRKSTLGEYLCTASNKEGTLTTHITLEKGTRPEPPLAVNLKGENSDSVVLEILAPNATEEVVDDHETPNGFNVLYKLNDSSIEDWDRQDFDINEENTYRLTNLEHDSEYEIKVATRNKAGYSSYTDSIFLHTIPSLKDGVYRNSPFYVNLTVSLAVFLITFIHWA